MQRLEVSGAVRPIYGSLGVKRLSEHRYWYGDKMKDDERGWKCSTRGTCKMHADVLSEILNGIGLMPDRCTYERITLKRLIKRQVGLWIRSIRLELGPTTNCCEQS